MKYLTKLPIEEWKKYQNDILGYTVTSDKKSVLIYDNWVNRMVIGQPYDYVAHYPAEVRNTSGLLPFQVTDVQNMLRYPFSLNYNKMGAGKTIEFIALAKNVAPQQTDSILIVCPKPTITQWVAKLKEWWPERAHQVKSYTRKDAIHVGDIVVTNYEKVSSSLYGSPIKSHQWQLIGVDEAHKIKNRTAQRTKAISALVTKYKCAMTGTPVLRKPDDLFSILTYLKPGIVGNSYWSFVEYFCKIEETFYGRDIKGLTENEKHQEVLKKLLKDIGVFNDIHIGMGKRAIYTPVTMEKEQFNLYKKIQQLVLDELPDSLTIPNGAVLKTRLLQTTSCPKVLQSSQKNELLTFTWGAKFTWLLEFLQVDTAMKVVVYSKFAQVIQQLRIFLIDHNVGCKTYTGANTFSANESAVKHFINDPEIQVLAGTIDSLGTGVDGLQQACHVCVFIDCDSRPTINAQAEDRLNRTGQTELVLCYYLECEKSVDSKIHSVNFSRTEDIRKLLGEGAL